MVYRKLENPGAGGDKPNHLPELGAERARPSPSLGTVPLLVNRVTEESQLWEAGGSFVSSWVVHSHVLEVSKLSTDEAFTSVRRSACDVVLPGLPSSTLRTWAAEAGVNTCQSSPRWSVMAGPRLHSWAERHTGRAGLRLLLEVASQTTGRSCVSSAAWSRRECAQQRPGPGGRVGQVPQPRWSGGQRPSP